MQKVAIMTDSNSGITQKEAKELGIFLLSMPFMIDGIEHYEGVNLSLEQFYDMLSSETSVSTSQPSPGAVIDMWEDVLSNGYDEVVYIPMSSGLSNSCSCAMGLAGEYEGKVQVVDNHRISVTMKHSVIQAIGYAAEGMSAIEIKDKLEKDAYEASIYITVDTLDYLKKGGRVTSAGAAIGSILNIKPVLTIQGDKLDAFAKVRGMKAARRSMINAITSDIEEKFKDAYEAGELCMYAVYSYVDDETINSWRDEIVQAFDKAAIGIEPLTMSVGCHIGEGALALAICKK